MGAQFSPLGNTLVLAMSVVSAEAPLTGSGHATTVVRLYNDATNVAYFKFSVGGGQTATSADNFIAPKVTELFSVPREITHVTAVLSSGTGNLYCVRGGGE
jgi:hypothetical protein